MRGRQMPRADGESFVFVVTEANNGLVLKRSFKLKIARSGINWITIEDDERIDLAAVQRLGEVSEIAFLVLGSFMEDDRLADVAERGVECERELLDSEW